MNWSGSVQVVTCSADEWWGYISSVFSHNLNIAQLHMHRLQWRRFFKKTSKWFSSHVLLTRQTCVLDLFAFKSIYHAHSKMKFVTTCGHVMSFIHPVNVYFFTFNFLYKPSGSTRHVSNIRVTRDIDLNFFHSNAFLHSKYLYNIKIFEPIKNLLA